MDPHAAQVAVELAAGEEVGKCVLIDARGAEIGEALLVNDRVDEPVGG
jgi:hypothetical protein